MVNELGNDWLDRESDLREIQANINRTLSDQQAINIASYNANDHLTEMRMGITGNEVQAEVHSKLSQMANLFPKEPRPVSVEDPTGSKNRWSKREIVETEENLEAFMEPEVIVERLIDGSELVTNNQMEVVRDNYPELKDKLMFNLLSGFENGSIELTERQKLKFGMMIDVPISHRHSGEALNVAKHIHQQSLMRGRQNVMRGQGMNMAVIEGMETNMQRSNV